MADINYKAIKGERTARIRKRNIPDYIKMGYKIYMREGKDEPYFEIYSKSEAVSLRAMEAQEKAALEQEKRDATKVIALNKHKAYLKW